jgi:hypothetical protein
MIAIVLRIDGNHRKSWTKKIAPGKQDAAVHLALQHDQLLPERSILGLKGLFDLERVANKFRARKSSAIIVASVRRFSHWFNGDEVFGTHRGSFGNLTPSPGKIGDSFDTTACLAGSSSPSSPTTQSRSKRRFPNPTTNARNWRASLRGDNLCERPKEFQGRSRGFVSGPEISVSRKPEDVVGSTFGVKVAVGLQ